mmetsp:Transcript_14769/g.12985  ORF Transcript_14769/g.12985 Transcript_14769/m.12985 type:complete len:139 (+) Transcript_14769:91-507(+)|eukprot:CAMPEP_0205807152 /NCGR_PEP_ID=MMETSP0205-20121125/10848_1 /ASSEMBLY_ACC=CAM_ASM_000278 /TAXON_ID=36767 /ORGANISM="Euplotes focardii, Strain TN1" /LENGTH=138 /DNA_ID=CAMNT_0053081029 /DNA_START=51 /DNA_END=467 /DNA_ORIENTATION=-
MIYSAPRDTEAIRISGEVKLDAVLGTGKVATVICARTAADDYLISDGTSVEAFGIMYTCSETNGCSNSLSVGVTLFGAEMLNDNSDYKWEPQNRVDISSSNKGTEVGDGLTISSVFGIDLINVDVSNIPEINATVYLK